MQNFAAKAWACPGVGEATATNSAAAHVYSDSACSEEMNCDPIKPTRTERGMGGSFFLGAHAYFGQSRGAGSPRALRVVGRISRLDSNRSLRATSAWPFAFLPARPEPSGRAAVPSSGTG